jgi:Raf kinase inhibitor-like YbhB/YbcL family protein
MQKRVLVSSITVLAVAVGAIGALSAQQGGRNDANRGGGNAGFRPPPLLMQTDAFPDGGIVPEKYAGKPGVGGGVHPGFKFVNAPENTVSYAIILHDMDVAINGNTPDIVHWLVWNIPASAGGIPEGKLPPGSVQGLVARQNAYYGPAAPAGPRYHHYAFELYALDAKLDLPPTAGRDDLLKAMAGKVTAKAVYVGRYRIESSSTQ